MSSDTPGSSGNKSEAAQETTPRYFLRKRPSSNGLIYKFFTIFYKTFFSTWDKGTRGAFNVVDCRPAGHITFQTEKNIQQGWGLQAIKSTGASIAST